MGDVRQENNEENEKEKEITRELFSNREELASHSRYAQEKRIAALIASGEAEKLEEILAGVQDTKVGKMSRNSFRQQLYAVSVGIALATRAAMDGGMNEQEAYTRSDIYIREADACTMPEQLWRLYVRMAADFARQVRAVRQQGAGFTEPVEAAVDYILRHLHYEISLKEIADHAGLSETYFSALFKKETGETVSTFIQQSRVREAESLLRYSEYSLMEIAEYLGFCSQSHFSKTFRRYAGVTPGQYRREHFKRIW